MPKFHELSVSGGDRASLLRYAVVAKMVANRPEDRTRRGAPQLLPALASDPHTGVSRSQTWFTHLLYEGDLLDEVGEKVLEEVDRESPDPGARLSDLRTSFIASSRAEAVAKGVDGRFWPELRRLPISRHPVDVIIAGCSTVNYLRSGTEEATFNRRDLLAVDRLQKGLSQISLSGYREAGQAIDLMAVLAWWEVSAPLHYMTGMPTGRRLARALDRALRIYLQPGEGDLELHKRRYTDLFDKVAKASLSVLKGPLTPATNSTSALRLVRMVGTYDNMGIYLSRVIESLLRLSVRGATTDVLVQREAFWYLLEMSNLFPTSGIAGISNAADLIASVPRGSKPQLLDLIDSLPPAGPKLEMFLEIESTPGDLIREPTHANLVMNSRISAHTWDDSRAEFKDVLDRHLPMDKRPGSAPWRALTKQIALPTRDLLRELLVTPASARSRTIVDTIRAAGPAVRQVTAECLEALLRVPDVLQLPIIARRAVWALGYLKHLTPTLLPAITQVFRRSMWTEMSLPTRARAIGDVVRAARDAQGAHAACEALVETLAQVEREILRDHLGVDPKRIVVAHAALHSLAIQRNPAYGPILSSVLESASQVRGTSSGKNDPHIGRLFAWPLVSSAAGQSSDVVSIEVVTPRLRSHPPGSKHRRLSSA